MIEELQEEVSVPLGEKYLLTIKEAAIYFNIGQKKMRRIAEDYIGDLAIFCGNRYLIKRKKFEDFIDKTSGL